jgi:hypothetical protein
MLPSRHFSPLLIASLLAASPALSPAATVQKGHAATNAGFKLDPVPTPAIDDAARPATFTLIDGERDRNSGELAVLADGKVPAGEDSPRENFFFAMNTAGGRIGIDLGKVVSVKSIGSYSWHSGGRGPQVYDLYAADGTAKDFNPAPKKGTDPATVGWKRVAKVDTRFKEGNGGGQHGVEISNPDGQPLGEIRHLLFDVAKTDDADPHGNTFFSEIDVIDAKAATPQRLKAPARIVKSYKSKDGGFRYIIDSTKAPALTEWTEKELLPVIEEWYPKLVEMLPSDGYRAPDVVNFEFRDDMGGTPAYAAGNRIALSASWFPGQLGREAKGCVVHEMGHVVQNYWRARQTNRRPSPTPGWVTEGICDYIRWFLYEPESKGAVIRDARQAKYDASYRVTANFLDWLTTNKDKDLVRKLNAAAREGRYDEKLWNEWTGKTVQELGEEWRKAIEDGKR